MSEGNCVRLTKSLPTAEVKFSFKDGKPRLAGDVDGLIREVEEGRHAGDSGLLGVVAWLLAVLREHDMLPRRSLCMLPLAWRSYRTVAR